MVIGMPTLAEMDLADLEIAMAILESAIVKTAPPSKTTLANLELAPTWSCSRIARKDRPLS